MDHLTSKQLLENLRFLRPTAKFKFAKDQFFMVGKVMREAADEIERLQRENQRLRSALLAARDWLLGWASAEPYLSTIESVLRDTNAANGPAQRNESLTAKDVEYLASRNTELERHAVDVDKLNADQAAEIKRLRRIEHAAIKFEKAIYEFGIKPEYIGEAFVEFSDAMPMTGAVASAGASHGS